MQASSRARGFTLVELLVTVSVAGILLTLATPSYRGYIANQRVRTAAYDLFNSLNYARSEAVKRNATVTVSTGATWSDGWVVTAAGNDLKAVSPAGAVAVTEAGGGTVITYQRNGRLAGAAAPTFSLCDPDGSADIPRRVIEIDLSGRPNLRLDGQCNA